MAAGKRLAIIGANGQLGMDLAAAFPGDNVVGLTHADIEIGDSDLVMSRFAAMRPALVVNTAAYHKVDDCEKNPARSFEVNAIGARNLARAAESIGFDLVHLSTDYVFDGEKKAPYVETDRPGPLNAYGISKLAGEYFISANTSRYYIVRTSGLYGHHQCRAKGGKNFIDIMLGLARDGKDIRVVQDEVLTPTYTYHLAAQIRELASTGAYGLYHATNNGSCSWYEYAVEIFRLAGLRPNLRPTSAKEFASPIRRPSYSVLENAGLQRLGIDRMPHWKESLAHYFSTNPV